MTFLNLSLMLNISSGSLQYSEYTFIQFSNLESVDVPKNQRGVHTKSLAKTEVKMC